LFGPYVEAADFSEGWAAIWDEEGCAFIDATGQIVLRLPRNLNASSYSGFCEGLATAQVSSPSPRAPNVYKVREGYINRQGEWVIKPEFKLALPFRSGLACVQVRRKFGLIDREGHFIVPPEFDNQLSAIENRVRFQRGGQTGFMNERGQVVIEPVYAA